MNERHYNGTISLVDLVTNESDFITHFDDWSEDKIRQILKDYQINYSEDEPIIIEKIKRKNAFYLKATCDSDFSYIAKINI